MLAFRVWTVLGVWSWLSGIAGLPSGPPLQAGACGVFSGALAYRHGGRRAFLAQAVEQVGRPGQVVDHPVLLAGPGMLDAAAEQLRLVEQLQVVTRLAAMTGQLARFPVLAEAKAFQMLQQILINPQSRFIAVLLVCVAAGRSGYLEAESRRPRWFILFSPAARLSARRNRRAPASVGRNAVAKVGARTGASWSAASLSSDLPYPGRERSDAGFHGSFLRRRTTRRTVLTTFAPTLSTSEGARSPLLSPAVPAASERGAGLPCCRRRRVNAAAGAPQPLTTIPPLTAPGRDVGRVVTGQVDVAGGQLFRLAGPAHRRIRAEVSDLLGAEGGRDQRRQIGPGATALTRMPRLTRFIDSDRVNEVIAPCRVGNSRSAGLPL